MDEVCFRDKRLKGTLDLFKSITTYELDKNTSIFSAFNFLKSRQKLIGKKIRNLHVLCHGLSTSDDRKVLGQTVRFNVTFSGRVQLGKENLTLATIPNWIFIRNLVDNIIVYACYAAATGPGNRGTFADGKMLMSLLAVQTNADVYASDKGQLYSPDGMQFKKWEGNVFKFSPNGQIKQVTGSYVQSITGKT